ncbi:GntR family transcriptional regulator [Clostridium felsineum]|uniref:HTH-type transcriptional repressor YtrA n=1 Tax=Clostridium felsineum TaxID=36839 RepID=A0A1S8L3N3_9CLOT|nr:GntR family transcriptional regulator [Clostridium felsineum]URZ09020.1 HTH-type transcriptional repressor YtrA [Clostridium felsineum]URZ09648.1 HTH-type transcriptional repressor YtrA [Clostridium felsineum]
MIYIDNKSSSPIYEQVIDQVKEQVIKGILRGGDKLPSVRQMASIIMVNPNTISRAYSELERQNIIETIKGKGTYVVANYKPVMEQERLIKLKSAIKKIIIESSYIGVSEEELINIIKENYKNVIDGGEDK